MSELVALEFKVFNLTGLVFRDSTLQPISELIEGCSILMHFFEFADLLLHVNF